MTLSGHVNTLPLADLIQTAAAARRSCKVHVTGKLAQGDLYVQAGEVVHARYGDLVGADAAYAMLVDPEAWFTVDPWPPEERVAVTISLPAQHLLLEAARRLDEGTVRRPTPLAVPVIQDPGARAPAPAGAAGPTSARARDRRRLDRRRGYGRQGWTKRQIAMLGAVAVVALVASASVTRMLLSRGRAPAPPVVVPPVDVAVAPPPKPPDRPAPVLTEGAPPASPVPGVAFSPTILVRLLVGPTGAVEEARLDGPRPDMAMFEEAALRAARAYRFEPAVKDGAPLAAWISYPVTFAPSASAYVSRRRVTVKGAEPLGAALGPNLAKAFEATHPGVSVTWEKLTSKAGFVALLDGSADLAASTRPLSAAELRDARALGLPLAEHVIGQDALAVVVHPENPLRALPFETLPALFRGEVDSWAAVGGHHGRVRPIVPRNYSDDRRALDLLVGAVDERRRAPYPARAFYFESADEIVATVARDRDAVGVVSRVLVTEDVRAVPLVVDGEPRVPAIASIRDGTYPLRRGLYLFSLNPPSAEVASFLRFLGSTEGQALVERWGFVPGEADGNGRPLGAASCATDAGAPARPLALRISFPRQATALPDRAKRALARLADSATRNGQRLLVVGHSDTNDGATEALRDSRARAQSVLRFLEDRNVPLSQVEVRIAGAEAPVDTNRTSVGRRRNRRVEVFVLQPER
jgi:phosphate transport system substrate-binding protein